MSWYSQFVRELEDAVASGELDFSAYCILAEAATRLRALNAPPSAHTRSDSDRSARQRAG